MGNRRRKQSKIFQKENTLSKEFFQSIIRRVKRFSKDLPHIKLCLLVRLILFELPFLSGQVLSHFLFLCPVSPHRSFCHSLFNNRETSSAEDNCIVCCSCCTLQMSIRLALTVTLRDLCQGRCTCSRANSPLSWASAALLLFFILSTRNLACVRNYWFGYIVRLRGG